MSIWGNFFARKDEKTGWGNNKGAGNSVRTDNNQKNEDPAVSEPQKHGIPVNASKLVENARRELDDEIPFVEKTSPGSPVLDDFSRLLAEKDVTNLWMMIMYNFPSHCGEKMTQEASEVFKEMTRVYELHRQRVESEQVYCSECRGMKYENDVLSCVHEKECHFWDTEDSRPRKMRPYWEKGELNE